MQQREDGFHEWTALGERGCGPCDVTGECEIARRRLREALGYLSPGAVGVLRVERLDRDGPQPASPYGHVLVRVGGEG